MALFIYRVESRTANFVVSNMEEAETKYYELIRNRHYGVRIVRTSRNSGRTDVIKESINFFF